MNWPFRLTRRLFLGLTGGAMAALQLKAEGHESLSAAEILQRMGETYLKCKTYQDSGTIVHLSTKRDRPFTTRIATAFVRPDRLHFQIRHDFGGCESNSFVWTLGKDVRRWPDVKQVLGESPTLLEALMSVGLVACSGVALLLVPEQARARWRLTELTETKRLDDAMLGEVRCFRVQGKCFVPWQDDPVEKERQRRKAEKIMNKDKNLSSWLPSKLRELLVRGPTVTWIDRETFLVRRIENHAQWDDGAVELTTTYEPVIDAPVSDEQLAFNPPPEEQTKRSAAFRYEWDNEDKPASSISLVPGTNATIAGIN